MAETTKIEWADRSWSPWIGCQKVGPGCDHCYAEALNKRTGGGNWGPGAPRRRTSESYWKQPYRWNNAAPSSVFPSLCDPFDNAVPREWRVDFGWIIRETPNLTWLLLTKRIGNAAEMMVEMFGGTAPENVIVGATMVNQDEVNRDWQKLMGVAHRHGVRTFGSMEPLLGPIELPPFGSPYIDWVIVGGESGPGARPMHPDWVCDLRDQCSEAGVPFLFKQWGEWAPGENAPGPQTRTETGARWFNDEWSMERITPRMGEELHCDDAPDVWRVGKKDAGRLLDGIEHNGFPETARG